MTLSKQDIHLLTDGFVCARRLVALYAEIPTAERPEAQMLQLASAAGCLEQFLLAVATPRQISPAAVAQSTAPAAAAVPKLVFQNAA